MRSRDKGQIRIIEAFFAVLIVFASFAISQNLTLTPSSGQGDDLSLIGRQALIELDSDGSIGSCIGSGEWSALRNMLRLVLPAGVMFNLVVYDDQMQQVNTQEISNGRFTTEDVVFLEYVCVSQESLFRCYLLHMYLAVAT